jgi:hypothetical protein
VVSDELTANGEVSEAKRDCCSPKKNVLSLNRYYCRRDKYLEEQVRQRWEATDGSAILSNQYYLGEYD